MSSDLNNGPAAKADLVINGQTVELNDFIEGFISQTVIGMVKSLRGVDKIETIDLKISQKP